MLIFGMIPKSVKTLMNELNCPRTHIAQCVLHDNARRAVYMGHFTREYYVSEYDDCWQTMRDVAEYDFDQIASAQRSVKAGVVEAELFSNDPRKDVAILYFLTEMGEKFFKGWAEGLMFDFEKGETSIELTREYLKQHLAAHTVGPTIVKAFDIVVHPDLRDLKSQFVFKKLRSRLEGDYFHDPEPQVVD